MIVVLSYIELHIYLFKVCSSTVTVIELFNIGLLISSFIRFSVVYYNDFIDLRQI